MHSTKSMALTLAVGAGLFATVTILLGALLHGNMELALVTVPLAGALLGFLRYNFNPASIFLGDSGSLTIGLILGCYGVLRAKVRHNARHDSALDGFVSSSP